ncbi:hypothetical protein D3C87_1985520 [compost metagenome]
MLVIFVNHLLRCETFFFCTNGNGYAVLVGAADERYFLTGRPEIANVYISRYIASCQVADVDRAIGVDQRCRDGISFGI